MWSEIPILLKIWIIVCAPITIPVMLIMFKTDPFFYWPF